MKKLHLFLTLLVTITLFSCGSDDDNAGNIDITEANLIAVWQWTSATENGVDITLSECDLMDTVQYRENNTATYTSHEQGSDSCIEFTFDSAWSLNGNIISYEQGDENETILELTETTLKVTYSEQEGDMTYTYVDTYTKK